MVRLMHSRFGIAGALLCICLCSHAGARATDAGTRYETLARVVDRSVGYSHLVRGVNICTVLALRDEVSEDDVEVLAQFLESSDSVHRLAAGYVLSVLGPTGIGVLQARGARLGADVASDLVARSAETRNALVEYRAGDKCPAASPVRRTKGVDRP
jgi:hypothetical protein